MNLMLNPSQSVQTISAKLPCHVEALLGSGGQGDVFRARLGSSALALKWYHPHAATPQQRAALEILIKKGPPSDQYLWPMELCQTPGVPGFGYLMPLREPRFKSGVDLMKRRIDPSFRVLVSAGLNLAHGFLQLHAKGLCYRDVSFNNVFLDPHTGDVLICDNDNVGIDGQAHSGVLGTPRFMAPEVVRGEALPCTQTDQFSLAVLLFFMFFLEHPLHGEKEAALRCFDLPAMTRLYGIEPVYLADPHNSGNRPVPGIHDNVIALWPVYPVFLKKLFERAFTKGLRDPAARVKESEWRAALAQLRDGIVYCPACQSENFHSASSSGTGKPLTCWNCKQAVRVPAALVVGKHTVVLNHDSQLFPHHVDDQRLYDFGRPVAEVSRHPTHPNVWGLKNLSAEKWVRVTSDGQTADVEPGRSVTLAPGTRIRFPRAEGVVTFEPPA
jgi:DNA-binding helix-hairpin-helix protein with protein kinase domain